MLGDPPPKKLLALCAVLLGAYAAVSLVEGPGRPLALFADGVLCLLPLAANFGLLANAGSAYRRRNIFWALWAIGLAVWAVGQLIWTIEQFAWNRPVPSPGAADFLFFLSVAPMFAALAVRPHRRGLGEALRYGYIDAVMLVGWLLYLYGFFLLVPEFAAPAPRTYQQQYFALSAVANLALIALLWSTWRGASQSWRRAYFHLLGAFSLHAAAWLAIRWAIERGTYFSGGLLDLPLVASACWFGLGGFQAYRSSLTPEPAAGRRLDHRWALRVTIACTLSMPVLGAWAMLESAADAVRRYRVDLTLATIVAGILLFLFRQRQVDRDRQSLLRATAQSLDKMNRLQAHLVMSEKLASLGELAAGAAHEINNPLTAIFGYAELLLAEPQTSGRVRAAAEKIHVQAERTRALVDNLLGFARQIAPERVILDMNSLLSSALQLRRLQLANRNVAVEFDPEPSLPAVRGDPKLLLQVFYEIITNAADAMQPGGGRLAIQTRLEGASVVIDFADTGPGIEKPALVFDPFYTTKAVGKGTGLGLSVSYGIIQEHGGQITCRNLPEGGASFRIELPALVLPVPLQSLLEAASRSA
ncbi:MAG TPA: ATP-binding protein [Candidatus Acidoferrales bacterium]|nr:ATP-binding protein [Candidatus Acidoferrales bacterium]